MRTARPDERTRSTRRAPTDDERQMARIMKLLSPDQKKLALGFVQGMASMVTISKQPTA